MDKISNKYLVFCICAGLVWACFTVFLQVRHHEFINFDDNQYIVRNNQVKAGLTWNGFVWAFTEIHAHNWHPLTWISHMLDCELFGLNPLRHHLVSLSFHIANTLLLFWVLKRMTAAVWQSAFVAAVFALHPLHVESVAWASERKDVLSTFFWLLTMWAYAFYVERPQVKRYLAVLLFFALGLMAKQMLVTLPFVLLLLDYWPLGRIMLKEQSSYSSTYPSVPVSIRQCILEKLPLFVLSGIVSVTVYLIQLHSGTVKSFVEYPLVCRIGNALVSYTAYIGKMLWPVGLSIFYPHPLRDLPAWQVAGSALLLACVTAAVIWKLRQRPYLAVGWLWYLGTLVPVIGLVQVGLHALADRYTYVPLTGLFIIIAWGIPDILARLRYRRVFLTLSGIVLLSVLGAVTWRQTGYWRNNTTLYTHSIAVVRNNWWAHFRLGMALHGQNKLNEAINHYTAALRFKPSFPAAHKHLGDALAGQGKLDGAVKHYAEAVRLRSDFAEAHESLGETFIKQQRFEGAIAQFIAALRIEPDSANTHNGLGYALAHQDKLDEAIRHYSRSLQLNPDQPEVHNNLAALFFKLGKFDKAIVNWTKVVKLKPDSLGALNNLAWLLAATDKLAYQNPTRAVEFARRACELTDYKHPELLDTLAAAYAAAGRFEEATETAEKAIELAVSAGRKDLAAEIQDRLQSYRAGQPYRQK